MQASGASDLSVTFCCFLSKNLALKKQLVAQQKSTSVFIAKNPLSRAKSWQ